MDTDDLPLEEQIARLKAKNDEILAEKKKAQEAKNELEKKFLESEERAKKLNDIDLEAYAKFQAEKDNAERDKQLREAKEKGEIDKLISTLSKRHQEEQEAIKADFSSKLEASQKQLQNLVRENSINSALAKAKVLPNLLAGAKSLISNRVFVATDENGMPQALVKVDGEDVSVEKFVCEIWANSEEGQAYRQAPSYAGGGANGTNNTSGVDNPFKTGNLTKQMELFKKDPKMYELLKKQAGM